MVEVIETINMQPFINFYYSDTGTDLDMPHLKPL